MIKKVSEEESKLRDNFFLSLKLRRDSNRKPKVHFLTSEFDFLTDFFLVKS